jgi:predicted lipoprotein with Yx(FWY)xxD motif
MRIKTLVTALLAVAATTLVVAIAVPFASGATSKGGKSSDPVKLSVKSVPGFGKILVNSAGRTLYMFEPDKDKKVTCVSVCAKIWPPLFLPAGAKAVAAGGAKQSLIGSDKDPAGGRVVTYNHWPLYLYEGDQKPGTAYGQALNVNGGLWYVLSSSGAVIKHKATKGGGGTTTTTTSTSTSATGTTTTGTTTTSTNGACPGGQDSDNDGDQNVGGPDDGDGCI